LYIEEFSKYPRSFTRAVNLEWVAFVKGLEVSDYPRAATYFRFFSTSTMASGGGMVYDVQQGASNETYVRWVLHHEFFHFVDDHLNRGGAEDRAWTALNPKGFHYTGVEAPSTGFMDHPRSGVITTYSMKSMWEDRADLFAALFVETAYPRLRQIVGADPTVRRKIRYMMRILEQLDPTINERYFREQLGESLYSLTQGQ
jgi:hypothetical protein